MKRTWSVTLQGDPPDVILVETETSSLLQAVIAQEIKDRVVKLGHDPRTIIDWEMEVDLDPRPVKSFGYWMPGGKTGKVTAATPAAAAQKVLGVKEVHWCAGETLSQPWIYVGNQTSCKLWLRQEEDATSPSGPATS